MNFKDVIAANKASTPNAAAKLRRTANDITLTGYVVSSKDLGRNQYTQAINHLYRVYIIDVGRAADENMVGERGLVTRPLEAARGERGFRFTLANANLVSSATAALYRNLHVAHSMRVRGKDDGHTDALMQKLTRRGATGDVIDYRVDTDVFTGWRDLVVAAGQARYFTVKAGPTDKSLPPGTLVTLRGITLSIFSSKAETSSAGHNGDGGGGGASDVFDNSPEVCDRLYDGATGTQLRSKLLCDVIFKDDTSPYHALPREILFQRFVDIARQQPTLVDENEFGGLYKCLVLPVDEDGSEPPPMDRQGGIVASPNNALRYIETTARSLGPGDPETYEHGSTKEETFACMPVNVKITHFMSLPADADAREHDDARRRFALTAKTGDDDNGTCYYNEFMLTSMIYSSATYSSGVVDRRVWCDMNAQRRMPCYVLVCPADFASNDSTVKAHTASVAWRTKEYVMANSFEVPMAFAKTILGNVDRLQRKLSFGKEPARGNRDGFDITNELNASRGKIDLLNASECSDLDLTYYATADNGQWRARVQLVVNSIDYTQSNERQRKRIVDLVEQARQLTTPEEGQRFVEDYVANKHAGDIELVDFGANQRTHRVVVWFVRSDEDAYGTETLNLPIIRPSAVPAPMPAPAADETAVATATTTTTTTRQDTAVPHSSKLKRKFEQSMGRDASSVDSDVIDVEGGGDDDDEDEDAPVTKKVRTE